MFTVWTTKAKWNAKALSAAKSHLDADLARTLHQTQRQQIRATNRNCLKTII